jgi:hypothetical protein
MKRPSSAIASTLLIASLAACTPATEVAASPPATGAAPAHPPAAPAAPPPPLTATDVLAQGRAPFDACFALARKTHPDMPRTSVEITFMMDDDGKLKNVDFAYRNRVDDSAKDCMRTAAEGLKFPPSLHGTQTGTIVFTPP